ncbi:MAG TPA: hypothetical protein VLX58_16110 [Bryobacteraceae bacterium]|nr:hypothetical protein [Bryobacteraceae bacterium]
MTGEPLLHEAGGRLRRAVASQAHQDLQAALEDYRRHFDTALANCAPDGATRVELARESVELIQWALRVTRAARAQKSRELERVSAAVRYGGPRPEHRAWKVEA